MRDDHLVPLWEQQAGGRYRRARRQLTGRLEELGVSDAAATQLALAASDPLRAYRGAVPPVDRSHPSYRRLDDLWPAQPLHGLRGVRFDAWTLAVLPNLWAWRHIDRLNAPAGGGPLDPARAMWPSPTPVADGRFELMFDVPGGEAALRARLGWLWQRASHERELAGPVIEPLLCTVVGVDAGHGRQPALVALDGSRRLAALYRRLGRTFADATQAARSTGTRAGAGTAAAMQIAARIRAGNLPADLIDALTVPVAVALGSDLRGMELWQRLRVWAAWEHAEPQPGAPGVAVSRCR